MLLVLPVCAAGPITVTLATPGVWLNNTALVVVITGTNFPSQENTSVWLNQTGQTNLTATNFYCVSDTQINVNFAKQLVNFGSWNVTVNNTSVTSEPYSMGTGLNKIDVTNAAPTLSSLSISSGLNNTACPFILTGTGFWPTSVVNLTTVSSTTPNRNITATNVVVNEYGTSINGRFNLSVAGTQAGQYNVSLTNPDTQTVKGLEFTVFCPPPVITTVNPLQGTRDTIQSITVTGTDFTTGIDLTTGTRIELVNGSTSIPVETTSRSATSITVKANLATIQVGPYNLTVNNTGPLYNNTTWYQPFRVLYSNAPDISSITPDTHVNTSNTSVTIVGHWYQPGVNVSMNRTGSADIAATSVVFNNVNNITCNLTTNGTIEGPWNVIVRNNDTQSSNSFPFVVTSYPASITNLHNTTNLPTSITWSWTDPSSANFNRVMVYLNGTFMINVTKGVQTYTATGLNPFTQYTIGTRTVANSGIINETWVNATNWTAPAVISKVGSYQNGIWLLDYNDNFTWDGTPTDKLYYFTGSGSGEWSRVIGDWNADGKGEIGIYKDGIWGLDINGNGVWDSADKAFSFAGAGVGWTPVIGDWNADGRSKVGVYKEGTWLLDYNGAYGWTSSSKLFSFTGDGVGWTPVIGDWNADGRDKVGIYRSGIWGLDYNGEYGWSSSSRAFIFSGTSGAVGTPVIGDWNADKRAKVGVYNEGGWALDYNGLNTWAPSSKIFTFAGTGVTGWTPIIGDWNADGRDKVGVYKTGIWGLDYNGLYAWDSSSKAFIFGPDTYLPVIGNW